MSIRNGWISGEGYPGTAEARVVTRRLPLLPQNFSGGLLKKRVHAKISMWTVAAKRQKTFVAGMGRFSISQL